MRVLPSAPMIRRILPSLAALALAACATSPRTPTLAPEPLPPPAAQPPAEAPRDIDAARAEFVRTTAQRFDIPAADIEAVLAGA